MKEYVKITYLPLGAKRRRTTWAIKSSQRGNIVTYRWCDKEGEPTKVVGYKDGVPVEQIEVIVCTIEDVVERPARMNLTYAELELVP